MTTVKVDSPPPPPPPPFLLPDFHPEASPLLNRTVSVLSVPARYPFFFFPLFILLVGCCNLYRIRSSLHSTRRIMSPRSSSPSDQGDPEKADSTPSSSSSSSSLPAITSSPKSLSSSPPPPSPSSTPTPPLSTSSDDYLRTPHLLSLASHGYILGTTLSSLTSTGRRPLCTAYTGIPYAQPPATRWRRAVPLPACYSYGTRAQPGDFSTTPGAGAGVCPQPGLPDGAYGGEPHCLQLNVWTPAERPPGPGEKGWPVVVYLHGGFMQFGTPNGTDLASLLGDADLGMRAVWVVPGYRLNLFGFLGGGPAEGEQAMEPNVGLWDQRCALEWVAKYVGFFGGDAGNVTLAGYSAGAYAVWLQTAFDLWCPPGKQLLRRAVMWSNGPGLRPKSPAVAREQLAELIAAIGTDAIPAALPLHEKLARLRALPASTLVRANERMPRHHQFRPVTDDRFIRRDLYADLIRGEVGRRMRARRFALLLGECRDEHWVYGTWRPPAETAGLAGVRARLEADYDPAAVAAVLRRWLRPDGTLPPTIPTWRELFGRVYADLQVHALQRGFVACLAAAAPLPPTILRYHIAWRARCVDGRLPPKWGPTHTSDLALWLWDPALTPAERRVARAAFVDLFVRFVRGDDVEEVRRQWGTTSAGGMQRMRCLEPDGRVAVRDDREWERGLRVWGVLREAGVLDGDGKGEQGSGDGGSMAGMKAKL